jgi:hypothetical protein
VEFGWSKSPFLAHYQGGGVSLGLGGRSGSSFLLQIVSVLLEWWSGPGSVGHLSGLLELGVVFG